MELGAFQWKQRQEQKINMRNKNPGKWQVERD